jgi:hypothetical protein
VESRPAWLHDRLDQHLRRVGLIHAEPGSRLLGGLPGPVNDSPVVAAFVANPNPIVPGQVLTLTATGVADPHDPTGTVTRVDFYCESNGIAGLQIGDEGDALVLSDLSAADDWSATLSTAELALDHYTYYVQAVDNESATSNVAATTVTLLRANLDADGNGTADALSDGILILRYLFDPGGAWNVNDAVGSGATRRTREAIRVFLDRLNPAIPLVPGPASESDSKQPLLATAQTVFDDVPAAMPVAAETAAIQEASTLMEGPTTDSGQLAERGCTVAIASSTTTRTGDVVVTNLIGVGAYANTRLGGENPESCLDNRTPLPDASDYVPTAEALDIVLRQWDRSASEDSPSEWLSATERRNGTQLKDDFVGTDMLFGDDDSNWSLVQQFAGQSRLFPTGRRHLLH